MNSERASAYGRVMRALEATSGLDAAEDERIRTAADSLFFCEDLARDLEARSALVDATALAGRLLESDRWAPEKAERLVRDLEACGPVSAVV